MKRRSALAFALALCGSPAAVGSAEPADLILHNAKVWTADEARPLAQAVAVRGNRIVKVGANRDVLALRGPASKVLDLKKRLIVPAFIDGHTHFENATEWFFEAQLMDVDTEAEMLARLGAATKRVPKGLWITGGDWGELEARKARRRGETTFLSFTPARASVEAASRDHPVLFRRHNGDCFANSEAMRLLRITKHSPDPPGGVNVRDAAGELTGIITGKGCERAFLTLPPKSMARTLIAARAIVRQLNGYGLTGIHDVARVDRLSQQHVYHTHVERSSSDVGIFEALRDEGRLTLRVYALLPLSQGTQLAALGITPGSGDDLIRYGALKSFIDGTLMHEPWTHRPQYPGDFTFRVVDEQSMRSAFIDTDRLGWDMATHQVGDKATALYLDWMEEAIRRNGSRDRALRLIHLHFPGMREIERAGALQAFADITPYHMIREIGLVEEQIGEERARTAFPARSLIDKGMQVNLVSDWPGDFYKLGSKPIDPLVNIFYAVARREIGAPAGNAWHPNEAITIEEGLRAYTINPARAAREERIKGSITEGKLADIVVLSKDILGARADDLLSTKVLYTIFDGNVVYEAKQGEG